MSDQKEIQEKLIRYQILDSRVKALLKRRDLLLTNMLEIETTLNTMKEIEKETEKEIFLPLASGVHVLGTLKKTKKMIVELGANVAIEETVERTKKILEKRKSTLNNALQTIENEMTSLSNELLKLEPEIRAMIEKSKTSTPEITAG